MKTVFASIVVALLAAVPALGQDAAKIRVAVVRLDRVMSQEYGGYDRLRLLLAEKEVAAGLKKIDDEMKSLQKQVLDVDDEVQLAEIGKRIELLNRKSNLLRQRVYNNPHWDMQKTVRQFVIDRYKNQFHLIAMDHAAMDRFFYKKNVEIVDITEDAAAKFRDYLDRAAGEP